MPSAKNVTVENRTLEFEALVTECQVVSIEVMGMNTENEKRESLGQGIAYDGDSFLVKAVELKTLASKLRALKV